MIINVRMDRCDRTVISFFSWSPWNL